MINIDTAMTRPSPAIIARVPEGADQLIRWLEAYELAQERLPRRVRTTTYATAHEDWSYDSFYAVDVPLKRARLIWLEKRPHIYGALTRLIAHLVRRGLQPVIVNPTPPLRRSLMARGWVVEFETDRLGQREELLLFPHHPALPGC